MASQNNSDYELLTEHLGYPPVSLLDDIINTVNVLADRALDSVERLLLSIPPQNLGFTTKNAKTKDQHSNDQLPPDEAAKLEIESGTHKLETLLTASIDRNFDKLELYTMQNILTVQPLDVRPHMRLTHYAGLDFTEDADDRPTVGSVAELRRRLQASQRLNVALMREKGRNEALLSNLKVVLGVQGDGVKKEDGELQPSTFGFLADGKARLSSIGSQTPITTTTQFSLSQLQALRTLSTSLRSLLPALESTSTEPPSQRTWRRERSEYVEANSRKYLENTAGLELGKQGEVRDGEYQGEGRGLVRGEVEGLERIVSLLEKTEKIPTKPGDGGEDDSTGHSEKAITAETGAGDDDANVMDES